MRYFKAPIPAPSQLFNHPKETVSINLVSREAAIVNKTGTRIQIIIKAKTCATVIECVTVGHNLVAKDVYKAFATSKPTTSPRIEANCFTKPFLKPIIAPAKKTRIMKISITII